jgi:hypothetical protein
MSNFKPVPRNDPPQFRDRREQSVVGKAPEKCSMELSLRAELLDLHSYVNDNINNTIRPITIWGTRWRGYYIKLVFQYIGCN